MFSKLMLLAVGIPLAVATRYGLRLRLHPEPRGATVGLS